MPTLIDNPASEWTDNEVIKLLATDEVERAATGASFGGIGRSNQQAQQLANRTAWLKQQIDIILAWKALFQTNAGVGSASYVRTLGLPATGEAQVFWATFGLAAGSSLVIVIAQWISGPGLLPGEFITYTLGKSFAGIGDYLVLPSNGGTWAGNISPTQFRVKNPTGALASSSILVLGI